MPGRKLFRRSTASRPTRCTAAEGQKPIEERLLVKKKADLGGDRVTESHAYYGNEGWTVQLKFDSEGAKKFGQITEANVGHRFAIVLDGVIQSAPSIRTAIYGGDAIITGQFTEQEARGLASVLENPLQTPVSVEEERSVSPTLGLDSIRSSIFAGLLGLAITLVFVMVYYKFAGLIANIVLDRQHHPPDGRADDVQLRPDAAGHRRHHPDDRSRGRRQRADLRAIAGGTCARANRSRSRSRPPTRRPSRSILDANVTTLITAAILFWKASGPVKGFAISLTLGILASLFTALIVGRNLFSWFVDTGKVQAHFDAPPHLVEEHQLSRQRLPRRDVFPRLAHRRRRLPSYVRGDRNFGVDFKGGDLLTLSAAKTVQVAQVRAGPEADPGLR